MKQKLAKIKATFRININLDFLKQQKRYLATD